MTTFKKSLASFALLSWVAAMPVHAESSAASSASDSVSTSVGSLSGSVRKSSDSSTTNNVAAGDYKVIDMAAVPEQPGTVRMKLQAVADPSANGEFFLYVPQEAVDNGRLAQGRIVTAHQRPYGVEFASSETRKAFFLVLSDDWYRELKTNAVVL